MGPQNAVLGWGDACGHHHWSLRLSSLWEALDTAAGAFGGAPSLLWGHGTLTGWGEPFSFQRGHNTTGWLGKTLSIEWVH